MPKSYAKREKERLRQERATAARGAAAAVASAGGKRRRWRVTDSLIGLSSAAILAVYGAGYLHTQRSDVHASTTAGLSPTQSQTSAPTLGDSPGVVTATPVPGASGYRDGTYVGWGQSRHGDIEATVVIQGGRIVSADISDCRTHYSCSYMNPLVSRVVANQEAPVDHVSGATDSSKAYTEAIKSALSQAV